MAGVSLSRCGITSACAPNFTRRSCSAGLIGKRYHERITAPPEGPVRESLGTMLRLILQGLRHGVPRSARGGLSVGMRDDVVGPAYLREILEPTLRAVETRLGQYVERRELVACDLRIAALSLLAALAGAVHQHGLRGDGVRPPSLPALCDEILDRFLLAYGRRRQRRLRSVSGRQPSRAKSARPVVPGTQGRVSVG